MLQSRADSVGDDRALLDLVKTTYFSHLLPLSASPDATSPPNGKEKGKKHGLPRRPVFADLEVVFVDESSVPGQSVRSLFLSCDSKLRAD